MKLIRIAIAASALFALHASAKLGKPAERPETKQTFGQPACMTCHSPQTANLHFTIRKGQE